MIDPQKFKSLIKKHDEITNLHHTLSKMIGERKAYKIYNKIADEAYSQTTKNSDYIITGLNNEIARINNEAIKMIDSKSFKGQIMQVQDAFDNLKIVIINDIRPMFRIICYIREFFQTIWYFAWIDGCDYKELDNGDLECKLCGHVSRTMR